jgi:hypothetical protein
MNVLSEEDTWRYMYEHFGVGYPLTRRVTQIARENGVTVEPWDKGAFTVRLYGRNSFLIEDGAGGSVDHVAPAPVRHYSKSPESRPARPVPAVKKSSSRKGNVMAPRRGTAPAPEPEVEEVEAEEGERDYTVYATKPVTATMEDFAQWLHEEVGDINEMGANDPVRLVALAGTLRMEFQKSDFNRTRREERRAERAQARAAEPEEAEEEAPAPAPKPGRGRAAKPVAAATAPAGKPAATARRAGAKPAATAPKAGKPATRRGAPKAEAAY